MLKPRNCTLDLDSHRYFFDPDGARIPMRISVTGVTNHGKDPDRFKGHEDFSYRGTHTHRAMECLAKGLPLPDPVSPEGIDCSDWFHQLRHGKIRDGLTMDHFWDEAAILATEFTMVNQKRSLGGQLDLLVKFRGAGWWISRRNQRVAAAAQRSPRWLCRPGERVPLADGLRRWSQRRTPALCRTMQNADRHAQPGQVDHPMDPADCANAWEEAWGVYSAASLVAF